MSKKEEKLFRKSYLEQLFPNFSALTEHEKTQKRKTHYYRQRLDQVQITREEIDRLTIAQIWELTRVDRSTIHRWKSGKTKIP